MEQPKVAGLLYAVEHTHVAILAAMFDLSKRAVVLTGATGNVGPAVLRAYLELGAHVAIPVREEAKGAAGYAMANAALLRWTESLAEEVKREGITANCVLPRIIDTPENRAAMPKADPSRWATAVEIAALVVFLSTDEASGITGAAIPIPART